MKKMYTSHALLALALIACVPSYAAQAAKEQHEESRLAQARHATKKQFDESRARLAQARHAAKKQLNESIARLKKCANLNCSKMEALKAARDVTIAILALYVGGRATEKVRSRAIDVLPKGSAAQRVLSTATLPVGAAARIAKLPGEMAQKVASETVHDIHGSTTGMLRTWDDHYNQWIYFKYDPVSKAWRISNIWGK